MKYYLANLINISSYKKMICTDIDGTLTLHDGNIGEFTIETIKNLTKNGYLVVLCTARSRESAIAISKKVGASHMSYAQTVQRYMTTKIIEQFILILLN